jgi:DNA (cytosine-5)-methyltransferase 1
MRLGTVCSGIGAPEAATAPLGWHAVWTSEIDPFACAVLAHHWPNATNHGDLTKLDTDKLEPIDVLIGGTPCQGFSVAGKRGGLDDPRSQLVWHFLRVADALRPRWLVWENVPGAMSTDGGRDFGAVVGALVERGYGVCWRILDAQFAGVPQRRRRIFLVGYLGDWRPAAAVLLERHSLQGNPPPSREARQDVAGSLSSRATAGGGLRTDLELGGGLQAVAPLRTRPYADNASQESQLVAYQCQGSNVGEMGTLRAGNGNETGGVPFVTHTLRGEGFDASEDGTGRGVPLVSHCPNAKGGAGRIDGESETFVPVAFTCKQDGGDYGDVAPTLKAQAHADSHANGGGQVAVVFTGRTIQPETRDELYDNAKETGPVKALRVLREAVEEKTLCEWCVGIVAAFWPQEVLRSNLHGFGLRRKTQPERGLVNVSLSRSQAGSSWTVLDLWQAGCDGCPPQGWKPSQQLAGELGAYLSQLPYSPSPAESFMRDMWQAAEGSRLLRQAFATIQEIRRSNAVKGESAHSGFAVRRLVPAETEALQGFPRGYTDVLYRGKPAADGPRYRALGNSMAVPVIRWIAERIERVDALIGGAA